MICCVDSLLFCCVAWLRNLEVRFYCRSKYSGLAGLQVRYLNTSRKVHPGVPSELISPPFSVDVNTECVGGSPVLFLMQ